MDEPTQNMNPQTQEMVEPTPVTSVKRKSLLPMIRLMFLFLFLVILVGFGGYFLGSQRNQHISPSSTPTPSPIPLTTFTDEAKIYTLKMPKNFAGSTLYSYITDSCTLFSDRSIVNPGISASDAAKLENEGTFITLCYTGDALPTPLPNKLNTPEETYIITSSHPFSINGYSGFETTISAKRPVVSMIILSSPYGGYVTISREKNGEKVFHDMVASFHFLPQTTKRFSIGDQTIIRKMFADEYKKDITVTFSHPSKNQNSVGGMVYLPDGQKCFNADRTSTGWNISYVGTGIFDSKCYQLDNI